MSVVILTREGIEHRYVAHALVDELGDEVLGLVVDRPAPRPVRAQVTRYRRRYTPTQVASRMVARAYRGATRADTRRDDTMRRILFPDGDPGTLPIPDRTHVVSSHNDARTLELLDDLQPDVIAVYGTLLIKPPTIRKARKHILNMHTGISPRYRGSDTYFWPLHNEEPEWVGTTIHHLDEGIDSGPIISISRPTITADDDPDSLFAKCVATGAEQYVKAVRDALADTLVGQPQDLDVGRNYLAVERTMAAERKVKRLLRAGLLRDVEHR